jgi:CHAD domain-containing protein
LKTAPSENEKRKKAEQLLRFIFVMSLIALNYEELQKPVRKLRKTIRKFPKKPSPDLVHDLRTRTRRVEANLHAVNLQASGRQRKLLKTIKPIRKKAGKVRDLDVLSGLAADLHGRHSEDEDCELELLEHVGAERQRKAKKLYAEVKRSRSRAARLLKRSSRYINRSLRRESGKRSGPSRSWPAEMMSQVLDLEDELGNWPRLTAQNLHPFRLKVKELRYILQLDEKADLAFIKSLGQVKDAIGEWHDWTELQAVAGQVLDHGQECPLIKVIRTTTRDKLGDAVAVAEKIRHRYLQPAKVTAMPRAS